MDWKLWLPVFLSIPISILAGLCVGPVQRLVEGWAGQSARAKRAERILQQTRRFVDHREEYNQYLIGVIIRLIIFVAMTLISLVFVVISLGIISFGTIEKLPLPKNEEHFFLVSALIALLIGGMANTALSAQVLRCSLWWSRVAKLRKMDKQS